MPTPDQWGPTPDAAFLTAPIVSVGFGIVACVAVCFAIAAWQIAKDAEWERDDLAAKLRKAEQSLQDIWMEKVEDEAKAAALSIKGVKRLARDLSQPVELTQAKSERVLGILFPKRKRQAVEQ